jgi:hypothetical protein
MHRNLAATEADLALGPAPSVADAAPAAAVQSAGKLSGVLSQHLLDCADPGGQTKTLERTVHILPSRLKARHERER